MYELIGYIVALLLALGFVGSVGLMIALFAENIAARKKPVCPKDIKVYAGHCMSGKCPRCGAGVNNCDGKDVGAVSFCPCCGRKIQFPKHKAIDGIKSVSADEYLKGVKRR